MHSLLCLPGFDEQLVGDDNLEVACLSGSLLLHIGQELTACQLRAALLVAHDGRLDSLSHPGLTRLLCLVYPGVPGLVCLAWLSGVPPGLECLAWLTGLVILGCLDCLGYCYQDGCTIVCIVLAECQWEGMEWLAACGCLWLAACGCLWLCWRGDGHGWLPVAALAR